MPDFGIAREIWESAKREAVDSMARTAKLNKLISYTDLVGDIKSVRLEPYDTRLDHLLEEIARDENAAGRGMLTVVVVHKTGDRGRDSSSLLRSWAATRQIPMHFGLAS